MRVGSLFSGAGGLDLAVEAVFGGRTVWQCEQDEAASKVLAYRWPGVPNLGDITAVDWSQVESVDVLCGGTRPVTARTSRPGPAARTTATPWAPCTPTGSATTSRARFVTAAGSSTGVSCRWIGGRDQCRNPREGRCSDE